MILLAVESRNIIKDIESISQTIKQSGSSQMDKLYYQLQSMREMPQLYLSGSCFRQPDLYSLKNFIMGFTMRSDGLVENSSITGFTEFVAEYYQEKRSFDWATIIHLHVQEGQEFKTFYSLYDQFILSRRKGGTLFTPPPHFQIGGVYKYCREEKRYNLIVLDYQGYAYLVAITDDKDSQETIICNPKEKKDFSFGWEFFPTMILPAETQQIGTVVPKGNYSDIGRIVQGQRCIFVENVADEKLWKNEGHVKAQLSLSEILDADILRESYHKLGGDGD